MLALSLATCGDTKVRGTHYRVALPPQFRCTAPATYLVVCAHPKTKSPQPIIRYLKVGKIAFQVLRESLDQAKGFHVPPTVIVIYPFKEFYGRYDDTPSPALAMSSLNEDRSWWIIDSYQAIPDEILIHEWMHYVIWRMNPKKTMEDPQMAEDLTTKLTSLIRLSDRYIELMGEAL